MVQNTVFIFLKVPFNSITTSYLSKIPKNINIRLAKIYKPLIKLN